MSNHENIRLVDGIKISKNRIFRNTEKMNNIYFSYSKHKKYKRLCLELISNINIPEEGEIFKYGDIKIYMIKIDGKKYAFVS
jgi:hypothetical protein